MATSQCRMKIIACERNRRPNYCRTEVYLHGYWLFLQWAVKMSLNKQCRWSCKFLTGDSPIPIWVVSKSNGFDWSEWVSIVRTLVFHFHGTSRTGRRFALAPSFDANTIILGVQLFLWALIRNQNWKVQLSFVNNIVFIFLFHLIHC